MNQLPLPYYSSPRKGALGRAAQKAAAEDPQLEEQTLLGKAAQPVPESPAWLRTGRT